MKKVLLALVIILFLSGCTNVKEVTPSQEADKHNSQIPEPGFDEGADCFDYSETQEFPITTVCVPDKESAIRITGIIIENLQKDGLCLDYVPLWVSYDTDDEIWVVTYGKELLPGGGMSIAIRKENAEIIAIWPGE